MPLKLNPRMESGRPNRGDASAADKKDDVEVQLLDPHSALPERNSSVDLLGLAPRRANTLQNVPSSANSVRILEVLPWENREPSSQSSSWRMHLNVFTSKTTHALGVQASALPKGIRAYYEKQDELISAYEALATDSKINALWHQSKMSNTLITRLSQISLAANVLLLVAKAVAVGLSNSMSIISSLVDSVVDLISALIIWWTSHAMHSSSIYFYPVGRSRLEPVAIIILSVIMSLASLEVMISSVRKMISFSSSVEDIAEFTLPTVLIASGTVVIKFLLALSFIMVKKKRQLCSDSLDALILDHRNDTLSNLVAILCGYFGSVQFAEEVNTRQIAYIDPAGAVIIALYIMISWWETGVAQLKMITGYTADPGFLSQITWIALNHSPAILSLDTVRAFHFGSKFLVEVDIVLCKNTVLMQSHNIGESLQQKLEKLTNVERAFVHVDYESEHRPEDEHLAE